MAQETLEAPDYCRFLRTKKMYIPALHLEADPREETDTAHFWCLKTHTSVGPDQGPVAGSRCRVGRTCCVADL